MRNKVRIITSALIFVSFIISITVFFTMHNKKNDRILFFLEQAAGKIVGETRWMPEYRDREKNIESFMSELFLGPAGLNLISAFPADTKVEKILLRDKKLFIDLNYKAIMHTDKIHYTFEESRDLIIKNIKFNFPFVNQITITVHGEEPVLQNLR